MSELLTVEEAAARLRVSPRTLRAWVADRRIGHVRLGPQRGTRFRESDLSAFIAACAVPTGTVKKQTRGQR